MFHESHDDLGDPSRPAGDEACDSDVDGALIGVVVGAPTGTLMILTEDGSGEALLTPEALLVAGAFVGFWGGLALDSLDCPFDGGG